MYFLDMVIMLSIREVRDSLEASAIYFSGQCHNKEDAQECYEALRAMARYRLKVEDKAKEVVSEPAAAVPAGMVASK